MDYALLRPSSKAEKAADQIIETMLESMDAWSEEFRSVGAGDTTSREAFAENVATRLGLVRNIQSSVMLHSQASQLERFGVELLKSGRTHEAHGKLDIARALRVAANYLEGTTT